MKTNLPNTARAILLDPYQHSVKAARAVEHASRHYEGEPEGEPDDSFSLPYGGGLLLELSDGSKIEVFVSDMANVRYWNAP